VDPHTRRVGFGSWQIPLPRSRAGRIGVGLSLLVGGTLGFLPILGFWMLPLGFVILSHDLPAVRRQRRRTALWWARRRRAKQGGNDDAAAGSAEQRGNALAGAEGGIGKHAEIDHRDDVEEVAAQHDHSVTLDHARRQ